MSARNGPRYGKYLGKLWHVSVEEGGKGKKKRIKKSYTWSGFPKTGLNFVGSMNLVGSKLRVGFGISFCSEKCFLGMHFW